MTPLEHTAQMISVSMRTQTIFGILVCAAILCSQFSASAQVQERVNIVALGASNTQGWGVSRSQAYPSQLQALLKAKGINAAVRNAGIPGDTTAGMLMRLGRTVPDGVGIVILQPGTNDERKGIGTERAGNIEKMRSRLTARKIKLIVIENAMLDALPRSELRADGVHFTPAGYAILADRIVPQVLAALGK